MPILEKDIQLAICELLALKKQFFWRQNTAPAVQKDASGWRFRSMPAYSKKGVPDIIWIRNGKFIGLEVKRPKGIQSDVQKEFESACKEAGGEYYVVTSVDDVIKMV